MFTPSPWPGASMMACLQPTGQQFVPTSISYLTLSILEVPIGDYLHCSHFIAEKSSNAKVLLSALVVVATVDLHVAASLLQICGSYCKLFDEEVRRCFSTCIAVDISDDHWQQAPLSLSFGGLGFDLYLITLLLLSSPSLASSIFGSDSNHLHALSKKLDDNLFQSMLTTSSPANKG